MDEVGIDAQENELTGRVARLEAELAAQRQELTAMREEMHRAREAADGGLHFFRPKKRDTAAATIAPVVASAPAWEGFPVNTAATPQTADSAPPEAAAVDFTAADAPQPVAIDPYNFPNGDASQDDGTCCDGTCGEEVAGESHRLPVVQPCRRSGAADRCGVVPEAGV